MKLLHLTTSILAIGLLAACGDVQEAANDVKQAANEAKADVQQAAQESVEDVKSAAKEGMQDVKSAAQSMSKPSRPGVDIGTAPSGTYKSESGHAYIAFSYDHQGYSKPILRWGEFDATVNLNAENPESSTLSVTIPVASIDSGVDVFDEHLVAEGFFDVANHPTITFKSTEMDQIVTGTGRVTGDLTIKGITKPVRLDVTLNKVGKNFRSGVDMFGISAKGRLKRGDFGLDKYLPVAEDVELMIEVEFQKEE